MKDLLLENSKDQLTLALIDGGELEEIYIERKSQEKLAGNIYIGRVKNVLPGMQAAFVDIGLDKNGFLFAGDVNNLSDLAEKPASGDALKLKLKAGHEIMVQVVKEPRGAKGPRLTSNITLPGRLAVLMPTANCVGVSRRIEDESARAELFERATRLKPEGMGLIVRTAALSATEETLLSEINYLQKLWKELSTRAETYKPPALLHRELSLLSRAVRDMMTGDVETLKIDDEELYNSAKRSAEMIDARLSEKIEFYQRETKLFDRYRVDHQLAKALKRQVWLKSGAYLVFDSTEAMTVVDVNTGKFVGELSLEETIFKVNCEAAREIARQLRLRDIGGIIVIDFIDMELEAHKSALVGILREALKSDRTKTNLVGMTGLGLVEMTRKKVHQPILEIMMQTCPVCQGGGTIMSDETVARDAIRALKERVEMKKDGAFLVETTQAVAGQLMLIGCPAEIHAFVHAVPGHRLAEYEISPINEHELPPKSRRIPRE